MAERQIVLLVTIDEKIKRPFSLKSDIKAMPSANNSNIKIRLMNIRRLTRRNAAAERTIAPAIIYEFHDIFGSDATVIINNKVARNPMTLFDGSVSMFSLS